MFHVNRKNLKNRRKVNIFFLKQQIFLAFYHKNLHFSIIFLYHPTLNHTTQLYTILPNTTPHYTTLHHTTQLYTTLHNSTPYYTILPHTTQH